jgi:hypothetical protein
MMLSKVLLPEPDGPTIAMDSPEKISNVILSNTCTGAVVELDA